MAVLRRSPSLPIALLALTLGGCTKKEPPPPTAEPMPSAEPAPVVPSTTPSSASPVMSAAPPEAIPVTKVALTRGESTVEYVQIKDPSTPAAEIVNRLLKKEGEKEAADIRGRTQAGIVENVSCDGGLPADDIFWVGCTHVASYTGRSYLYMRIYDRVWSLAGKEPSRLELPPQLSSGWIAAVDAWCMPHFEHYSFVEDGERTSVAEDLGREQNFRPLKEGLFLRFMQGLLGPLVEGIPECTVPWGTLAPFLRPGSPLRPLADAAPPGPPPRRPTPLEDRSPPEPFEDPGRKPQGLQPPLDAQQRACEGGDQRACVKVGEALLAGNGVSRDEGLAVWIFQKACDAGEPTGCVNLGWVYLNNELPRAGASAAPIFAKACNDKVTIGCLGLGTIYRDGRDTPKDAARAAELFKRACDGGVKAACSLAKAKKP